RRRLIVRLHKILHTLRQDRATLWVPPKEVSLRYVLTVAHLWHGAWGGLGPCGRRISFQSENSFFAGATDLSLDTTVCARIATWTDNNVS
ncbi:hypothetical protein, partial [Comamonas thiooxydans]|uniref:hypothetical protein n=1 Tax=Comamonas thiooxydans TaxID=363952 RepID=UPI001A945BC8